mgnify:CR=1 FL=1
MIDATIAKTPSNKPFFFKYIGLLIFILLRIRHLLRGYRWPRTFSINEFEKAVNYDLHVVEHWLNVYSKYAGESMTLEGKSVLELGPGADLGIGLILLLKGAKRYNAIDVNNLVKSVPDGFYKELFRRLEALPGERVRSIGELQKQLSLSKAGNNDRLNYVWSKTFAIADAFSHEPVDIVFSQAAFEHFDDPAQTISEMSAVVRSGAILIAEIDLKTHTKWIRDADPLNIFRYSDAIYNMLKFRGAPNRVRPFEYKKLLEDNGWHNVMIIPLTVLDDVYLLSVLPGLNRRFQQKENQMQCLSIMICATKK